MKFLAVIAVALLLAGCDDSYKQVYPENRASMPEELKDCKFFSTYIDNKQLYVVRCPVQTTTTYKQGKSPAIAAAIDNF